MAFSYHFESYFLKSTQPKNSLQRSMEAHMVKVHDIAIYKCAYCENVAFKKKSEFIKVTKNN